MMYFISLDSFKFVFIFFGLFFVISFQEWQKKKEKNEEKSPSRTKQNVSEFFACTCRRFDSIDSRYFSQHRRNFVHSIRISSYRAQ